MRLAAATLVSAAVVFAQTPDDLLSRGRARVIETLKHLTSRTCTETIERSEFRMPQAFRVPESCDQILASRTIGVSPLEKTWTDRLRVEVEITDRGMEIYSWPGAGRISSERIQDFSAAGVIGSGAFGPFLIDIFANQGVRFWREDPSAVDGRMLSSYRFLVPEGSSHLQVVAGRDVRIVGFDGRFWLDPETADVRRLLLRTPELSRSTGNCEASTTVDFSRIKMESGDYLLPSQSVLRAVRRDAAEAENITTFSACHEFRGESVVHFGDGAEDAGPAAGTAAAAAKVNAKMFPPGVRVTVAIGGAIDLAQAAAGDPITARVRLNEAKPRKRLIPEAGVAARCRLSGVERTFGEVPEYALSIACESIQLDGAWVPFAAVRDEPKDLLGHRTVSKADTGFTTRTRTTGRRPVARGGGTFVFPSSEGRYVVQPFTSQWISVLPEKAAKR